MANVLVDTKTLAILIRHSEIFASGVVAQGALSPEFITKREALKVAVQKSKKAQAAAMEHAK